MLAASAAAAAIRVAPITAKVSTHVSTSFECRPLRVLERRTAEKPIRIIISLPSDSVSVLSESVLLSFHARSSLSFSSIPVTAQIEPNYYANKAQTITHIEPKHKKPLFL